MLACSSPTGPAFEGAQISSGQRAAPGAIERVAIDPVDQGAALPRHRQRAWSDEPGFPPDTRVTGICGSGIIEAVAEMRLAGLLDASGLIGSAEQTGTTAASPRAAPTPTGCTATSSSPRATSAPSSSPSPRSTPARAC